MTYTILCAIVFLTGLVAISSGKVNAKMRWILVFIVPFFALIFETALIPDPISLRSGALSVLSFTGFFAINLVGMMLGIALRKSGYHRSKDHGLTPGIH